MLPYSKLNRAFGSGRVRLGTFLSFREDMYALMFVSNFKMKWVFKYRNEELVKAEEAEQRELLEERMLDEFKTGRTMTSIPSPRKKGEAHGFEEKDDTPNLDKERAYLLEVTTYFQRRSRYLSQTLVCWTC